MVNDSMIVLRIRCKPSEKESSDFPSAGRLYENAFTLTLSAARVSAVSNVTSFSSYVLVVVSFHRNFSIVVDVVE
jgi:hypothetical protein